MGVIDYIKCIKCKQSLQVLVLKDTMYTFPCKTCSKKFKMLRKIYRRLKRNR